MPYIVDDVGQTTQPAAPSRIKQYWLDRGLVYLSLGNGLFWSKSGGWTGQVTRTGGPKRVSGVKGVVTGYGTTDGTGATDRTDAPSVYMGAPAFRSHVVFVYPRSTGGGTFGRVINPVGSSGVDSAAGEALFADPTNTIKLKLTRLGPATTQAAGISGSLTLNAWSCFGFSWDQTVTTNIPTCYENGVVNASVTTNGTAGAFNTSPYSPSFGNRSTTNDRGWDGLLGPLAIFDHPTKALIASEHQALAFNPWQLLEDDDLTYFDVGGAGSRTTSGALTASAATIAGTATHLTLHTTSGAFTAQAATIAGAALRYITHTTTGALTAGSATIAGVAAHQHAAVAALIAGSATIAGAATRASSGTHATSGAFVAGAATLAGTATHLTLHTTSGGLVAGAATVSGTATHKTLHTTSGALIAGAATIAGVAVRPTFHTSTGALVAGAAQLSGAGYRYLPSPNTAAPALSWVGDSSLLYPLGLGEKNIPSPAQGQSNWAGMLAQTTKQPGIE